MSASVRPGAPDPLDVWVVEDNRMLRESLADLLNEQRDMRCPLAVGTCGDFLAALDLDEPPDIVLMDIGLPILNGYEACRRIRSQAWGAPITMVAITGWGQEDDREESNAAGFDLHLVKPVDHDELLRIVGSARPRASA